MALSIDTLPSLEEIKIEKARRHLLPFTTYTKPDYEVNWHHKYLAGKLNDFVQGKINRLMVFMPPRYGKSELVSRRLPAYALGKNPDEQVIACSYGSALSSQMNRDVQRIIDSEKYEKIFPDTRLFGENVRSISRGHWLRNSDVFEIVGHTGSYRSSGIGGSIVGSGFTLGIIDDPIKNHEEARSVAYRESLWEWYTSTFYTRMEKGARILLTMTRWHEDDLAGRLLRLAQENPDADRWEVVSFPAILEEENENDPREIGEPLWPSKFNEEALKKTKVSLGTYQWSALYQQSPQPAGGGMFKRNWWQFYKKAPDKFDEIIQSWDMTFKDSKGTDYVVGQVWGRKGADKYLLDQVRDRMDFPATLQAVKTLSSKWPEAITKLVEDKANGPAIIASLKREIPGLIPVTPLGGKEARAAAISPEVEAGNVYLPDSSIAPWIHDFIGECAAFPTGVHDDQVDAMTQALNRLAAINNNNLFRIGRVR